MYLFIKRRIRARSLLLIGITLLAASAVLVFEIGDQVRGIAMDQGIEESGGFAGNAPVPAMIKGRVVFSNSPIDPANPTNLKNKFEAGEPIYCAVLLDGPLREFVSDQSFHDRTKGYSVTRPGFEVDFQIDGSQLFDGSTIFVFQLDKREGAIESVPNDNFLIFDISPTKENVRTYQYEKLNFPLLSAVGRPNNKAKAGAQYYSFHIGKLKSGPHTVSLTFSGSITVKGEITVSGSNFGFYSKLADDLEAASGSNTTPPASAWNNPAVERSVTAAYRKLPGEQVLRTILISPSWFIQRNTLGLIMHRGLFAVIVTRAPDGKCYIQKEYFKQLYGGGSYGATTQDGRSETRQQLPCANANR